MSSNHSPVRTLLLTQTWFGTARALCAGAGGVGVLSIINRLAPRRWSIRVLFNRQQRTVIDFTATPRVTTREAQSLLDATVPEVYRCDTVEVVLDGRRWRGDVRALVDAEAPRNDLMLRLASGSADAPDLSLEGYCGDIVPASLQSETAIRGHLMASTWMGSEAYSRTHAVIDVSVLGTKLTFTPAFRLARLAGPEWFEARFSIVDPEAVHAGECLLACAPELERNEMFHALLGELDPEKHDKGFWATVRGYPARFYLELAVPQITDIHGGEMFPRELARRVVKSVRKGVTDVVTGPAFRAYLERIRRLRLDRAAAGLSRRQEKAQESAQVHYRGVPLQTIPTSENEVISLLCKLEGMGGLPLKAFRLQEYTPRQGIDALCDFRWSDVDQPVVLGAVEVEHQLENFFAHNHPVEQVSMVVCWDRGRVLPEGAMLQRQSGGKYLLKAGSYVVRVLVLREIPGIALVGG